MWKKTPKEKCKACNFTKSDTSPWVFFTFLKVYKGYQNCAKHHIWGKFAWLNRFFSSASWYISSRSRMFFKIYVLKIFGNIHRKTPVLESVFNKVTGLHACNSIKKRHLHKFFPVNIGKFLRIVFYRTPPVATSQGNEVETTVRRHFYT